MIDLHQTPVLILVTCRTLELIVECRLVALVTGGTRTGKIMATAAAPIQDMRVKGTFTADDR